MSGSQLTLIAGLGNPGKQYAHTRHNIGFLVADCLAARAGTRFDRSRFDADYAKTRLGGRDLFLVKPTTYMNLSGQSLQRFSSYFKIDLADIIVVHDDMDLRFGQLTIARGRGHGGHNGVRSIIDSFGRKDCTRVRTGVGHPGGGRSVTGHVLGRFSPDETAGLETLIETAADACICLLDKGLSRAMNAFNTKS